MPATPNSFMAMPPHSFSYPPMGPVIPYPMYHAMVQQVFTQMMEAQGQDVNATYDLSGDKTPSKKDATTVRIEDKFTEIEL